jgi:hypothetical protein
MSPASTLNIYLFEGPILQKPLFVISVVKKIAHSSHSTPQNYSKLTEPIKFEQGYNLIKTVI